MRCRFLTLLVLGEREVNVLHAENIVKLVKVILSNGPGDMVNGNLVLLADFYRACVSMTGHVRGVRFFAFMIVGGAATVNHAKMVVGALLLYRMAKDGFRHRTSADITQTTEEDVERFRRHGDSFRRCLVENGRNSSTIATKPSTNGPKPPWTAQKLMA